MSASSWLDKRLQVSLPRLAPVPCTLTSIAGLRAACATAGIKASGKPDIALLVADEPVAAAGVFTQNKFAAAPVQVCREHLAKNRGQVRAIVGCSGNANACTGKQGLADAREMCRRVAQRVGCPVEQVLVASTGVIGVKLPMDKVRAGIDRAFEQLSSEVEAGRRFLAGIKTTDAFSKEACETLKVGDRPVTVAGVCKGAGMIHPNMATLLSFVATDAAFTPAELRRHLPAIAGQSFNALHVDTHPSTNDTFVVLATGKRSNGTGKSLAALHSNVLSPSPRLSASDTKKVVSAITKVARKLAWLIARDGEGATKVTTIEVAGARSDAAAKEIATTIAASALVRTALYGNDPNWGRFVSQAGNSPAVRNVKGLVCTLQGITVFKNGEPTAFDRAAVSKAMKSEDVSLTIQLCEGKGQAYLMTSDLGYKYVEINAEYTT